MRGSSNYHTNGSEMHDITMVANPVKLLLASDSPPYPEVVMSESASKKRSAALHAIAITVTIAIASGYIQLPSPTTAFSYTFNALTRFGK